MIKVDERHRELANAFRFASAVGVFDVIVQITIRGERRKNSFRDELVQDSEADASGQRPRCQ